MLLVLVLRTGHGFCTGELADKFVRSVDERRKALRAHPDLSPHELQRKKRQLLLRLITVEAVFQFC